MLRKLSSFTIVVVALLLIVGCSGSNTPLVTPDTGGGNTISNGAPVIPEYACVTDIIGGQHYYAGYMYYWPDPNYLTPKVWHVYVKLDDDEDCNWTIKDSDGGDSQANLFVDWNDPVNNPNWFNFPSPGHMPYTSDPVQTPELMYWSDTERYWIVTLPDTAELDPSIYLAAHVNVCCNDDNGGGGGGGYYSSYCYVEVESTDLIAGQHFDAGDIAIYLEPDEDGGVLNIKVSTQDDWQIYETHLFVGCDKPTQSAPGQFPFGEEDLNGVDTWEWSMPMSDLLDFLCDPEPDAPKKYDSQCWDDNGCELVFGESVNLCFALHAVVKRVDENGEVYQSETAWGHGDPINQKGNWAMYWCSWIDWNDECGYVEEPGNPGGDIGCQTGWAFGNQDFRDPPVDNPRWGWWIEWPEFCPPQDPPQ
jgi:hypothetical protein